jgi:FkbM family methyltransferase
LNSTKIHSAIIHSAKLLVDKEYRELTRIKKIPRYQQFKTSILGRPIKGVDSASFVFTYNEIFKKEIYRFTSQDKSPTILDCGANIGLSIIYFKKIYPASIITAFEADNKIYNVLSSNINSLGIKDVTIINKAVWDSETKLNFYAEGADGGRVSFDENHSEKIISTETIRLKNYLKGNKITLLKVDIEGAETKVLIDCAEELKSVENLIVEYHSFEKEPQSLPDLLAVIKNAGFRIYALPVGYSNHPLVRRDSYLGIDLQFNIFGYRV